MKRRRLNQRIRSTAGIRFLILEKSETELIASVLKKDPKHKVSGLNLYLIVTFAFVIMLQIVALLSVCPF